MALPTGAMLERRYKIERLLARGGMGAIYQAVDTNLNIPVAIKENFFSTPQSIRQFKREAQILARLHHLNLPRVIHHFSHEGKQYLVMDFIAGQDLWQMVQQQGYPLDEGRALDYLMQVCDAVDYLHRQQPPIIHRDIKPQNIKITPAGQAVLVDFGIAKVIEADGHTMTGAQGVTPGFSPPEQYSGEGTGPGSDIYSLGATLYAVLTGKKPPASISLLVDRAKFKPPAELNDKLSQAVSEAVMHAMQPRIEDRPPSVAAWRRELEAILASPTVSLTGDDKTTLFGEQASPGWLVGPDDQRYRIRLGSQTLGRASTCDFQIIDPLASRHHATIRFDGQRCLVFDAGSANGTYVNRQRVSAAGAELTAGSQLRIGDTIFTLNPAAVIPAAPPSSSPALPKIDDMVSTAFEREPDLELPPSLRPVSPGPGGVLPQAGRARSRGVIWLWLGLATIALLLLVLGVTVYSLLQEEGIPPLDLSAFVAAAATATEQTRTGDAVDRDAEATVAALAMTVTAQAAPGETPAIDIEGTVAAAIAATEAARAAIEPPTATFTASPLPATPTSTPSATFSPTPEPPTLTPTPEPTPLPTATPAPTATLPPRPTATAVQAAAPGVFQSFEQESVWRRGDEPNGEFSRSSEQVYAGSFAGRLDYRFTTAANDYVVFLQSQPLAGQPQAISAWVYGDGAGHFLNVWLRDSGGQTWQMSFGQISHTGWREMTAALDPNRPWPSGHISGPNNGQIDYPISFQGLVLDDGSDDFVGRGAIYLDNLATKAEASAGGQPLATITPSSPPTAVSGDSSRYVLAVAGQHTYEPWGAPRNDDICASFRAGNFNDRVQMKGFNLELSLTNNASIPVADNWEPTFITAKGQSVQVCYYGYAGSGPAPGATTFMTFFTIVEPDDYVRLVRLTVNGETVQICLDPSGAQTPC